MHRTLFISSLALLLQGALLPAYALPSDGDAPVVQRHEAADYGTNDVQRHIATDCETPVMQHHIATSDSSRLGSDAVSADSSMATYSGNPRHESSLSRIVGAAYIPLSLIAAGIIASHNDRHDIGPSPIPLERHGDGAADYLQFLPAALMLSMKAAGIESRSSWTGMIGGCAASGLIMAGMVKGMKHIYDMPRPDASDTKSLPSGHTAMAFMSATMLSIEYGHLSPWITAGAYGLATATGLMRVGQNKHWASDIVTGAGIGILATEIGYMVAGAVMGGKSSVAHGGGRYTITDDIQRSNIGLYTGMYLPASSMTDGSGKRLRRLAGTVTGIEGAWYIWQNVGLACHASLSESRIVVDGAGVTDVKERAWTAGIGPCAAIRLAPGWCLNARVAAAYIRQEAVRCQVTETSLPSSGGIGLLSGIGMSHLTDRNIETMLFVDHALRPRHEAGGHGMDHAIVIGGRVMVRI